MINIFIANLDWEVTSEDLKTTFSAFGAVAYAHVVYEKGSKRSKGFGYVEMEDMDQALAAIDALNGMEVNDRKLDVKLASPKTNRPEKKVVEKKPFEKRPFQKKPYQKFDKGASTGGQGSYERRGNSTYGSKPSYQKPAYGKTNSSEDSGAYKALFDSLPSREGDQGSSQSTASQSTSSQSSSSENRPERIMRPRRKNL